MDLTDKNREAVFALPPEKKWQIYCSKKKVPPPTPSAAAPGCGPGRPGWICYAPALRRVLEGTVNRLGHEAPAFLSLPAGKWGSGLQTP